MRKWARAILTMLAVEDRCSEGFPYGPRNIQGYCVAGTRTPILECAPIVYGGLWGTLLKFTFVGTAWWVVTQALRERGRWMWIPPHLRNFDESAPQSYTFVSLQEHPVIGSLASGGIKHAT